MKRYRSFLLDSLLLSCFVAALIWPIFHLEYLDNWQSIESTFISDARMVSNNLPHTGWQPLWYCGTRFDYVYPPALRYGTALISRFGGVSTARAYHLYTGFFYIFGIVAIYWLVRIGSRSRWMAMLASVATVLLSPSFLFLPTIRIDSGYWVPQRLHVLMSYGEGPHVTALGILGATLALSFVALRKWKPGALALAALLAALTVANNFYGATALAIFFPILVWAIWTGERDRLIWFRAGGIAALAWGLDAFWLTPSYVKITLTDLQWVATPGNSWSSGLALVVTGVFCAVSWSWGKGRSDRAWTIFVAGAAVMLSLNVLGSFWFGFRVSGDTARLIPELDLALILAFLEIMRHLSQKPRGRVPVAILIVAAFLPAARYAQHLWSPFPASDAPANHVEKQIASWVHEHLPGERVLSTGTIRFWFDAWADNAELDGGSMQGMLNQNIPVAIWQVLHGEKAEPALLWLKAMGTDALIVPFVNSREHYRDIVFPQRFAGAAPVLFDDSQGTVIYRVPRVHPGVGRIVMKDAIASVGKVRGGDDVETLSRYVAVVENPELPAAELTWPSFDEMRIRANVAAGQALLLQETWDPGWHAYVGGKEIPVRPEPVMTFMLVDLPPGNHTVQMRFETPFENQAGRVALALSMLTLAGLVFMQLRLRR